MPDERDPFAADTTAVTPTTPMPMNDPFEVTTGELHPYIEPDYVKAFPLRSDPAFRERLGWLVLALIAIIVAAIGFLLAALVTWAFRRAMGEV